MDYLSKLAPIAARHTEISGKMSQGGLSGDEFVKLSKEYAELQDVVDIYNDYKSAVEGIAGAKEMLSDPDMAELAQAELDELEEKIPALEDRIKIALLPRDAADSKNAVMEIRAGTGGDEAALFAADLFTMYRNYAAIQGWRVEIIEMSESDLGGYKEIIANFPAPATGGRCAWPGSGLFAGRILIFR